MSAATGAHKYHRRVNHWPLRGHIKFDAAVRQSGIVIHGWGRVVSTEREGGGGVVFVLVVCQRREGVRARIRSMRMVGHFVIEGKGRKKEGKQVGTKAS